jgi:amino-acid N-acetyltransferase
MIKKAGIGDIRKIHTMVNNAASRGEMLPRPLGELYDNLRDYFVCEEGGDIIGTGALHICWEDLAEIRSLIVAEPERKKGIGRLLVNACIDETKHYGISKIFLLTYQVGFFERCGFKIADKKVFPQKIWSDCVKCHKFPECDEIAMMMEI